MSDQVYASNIDPYWLSTRGVDNINFNKQTSPPLAYLNKGILYEMNDGHLYYNGTQLDGATSSGDVVGPSSSVNNDIAVFDGTTGKLVKDSSIKLVVSPNIASHNNGSYTHLPPDPASILTNGTILNFVDNDSENVLIGSNDDPEKYTDYTGKAGNTPFRNTCVGVYAGGTSMTSACTSCTLIGRGAGSSSTTGYESTFIGDGAGFNNTTGIGNVCIGYNAGSALYDTHNNIYISHAGNVLDSGVIRIGRAVGADKLLKNYQGGIYDVTTASATTQLVSCSDEGQLGTNGLSYVNTNVTFELGSALVGSASILCQISRIGNICHMRFTGGNLVLTGSVAYIGTISGALPVGFYGSSVIRTTMQLATTGSAGGPWSNYRLEIGTAGTIAISTYDMSSIPAESYNFLDICVSWIV